MKILVIDDHRMFCDGLKLILADVTAAIRAGIGLAETHKNAVMAGRTFLQQAVPITFAFKAANWTAGLVGVRVSLIRNLEENIALQFGGAAGTLSALGPDGRSLGSLIAQNGNSAPQSQKNMSAHRI